MGIKNKGKCHSMSCSGLPEMLVIICLFLVTFCYVLPQLCKDKIFSIYYEPGDKNDVVQEVYLKNLHRFQMAASYLKAVSSVKETEENHLPTLATTSPLHGTKHPSITVGVITIQRPVEKERKVQLGYLAQVVAKLHQQATVDRNFAQICIFICNVDTKGTEYREAMDLSFLFDIHVKYNGSTSSKFHWEPEEVFEKEKQDYAFCLNKSLSYGHQYTVLLEDDAVPKSGFFGVLYTILNRQSYWEFSRHRSGTHCPKSGDWAFTKLYYPQKWAGYSFEVRSLMELIILGTAGGLLFVAVYLRCKKNTRTSRAHSKKLIVIFVLGVLYITGLLEGIGRPYVIDYVYERWGWFWVINSRQCCTQAVLYPVLVIPSLIQYIESKSCDIDYSVDLVLDDFVADCQMNSFLIEPNIVSHIGMFSSLRPYSKRAGEFT